jgi:hypothetical protein
MDKADKEKLSVWNGLHETWPKSKGELMAYLSQIKKEWRCPSYCVICDHTWNNSIEPIAAKLAEIFMNLLIQVISMKMTLFRYFKSSNNGSPAVERNHMLIIVEMFKMKFHHSIF